jgi:hypothetical protein
VQKSRFQLAKIQKMNIHKHIKNEYRTDVSLNFDFSNDYVYTCTEGVKTYK